MAAEQSRLDDLSIPGSTRYERCLSLAHSNPSLAYDAATRWNGGAPAIHCSAVALINLKRYTEAASRLDKLAHDKTNGTAPDRATLYDQAGNAWLLAKRAEKADASFSAGLMLAPGDPDLLSDRARAKALAKDWNAADQDLSMALARDPSNAEFFVLRASARHALGRKSDAHADLEQALHLKPNFAEALLERGNLEAEEGNTAGAKSDWQAASDAEPRSAAGMEARQRLANLQPKAAVPAVP